MKILVIGAGLSGSTVARVLADAGHYVHVIDKRDHVAGNAYDYRSACGFMVHLYGPHLFHTNNERVFSFLSRFTDWVNYEHRVVAKVGSDFYPFPPNAEVKKVMTDEQIVDTFYRPYTRKMWGKEIEEINPEILNRVPRREDYEDRYFPNDRYQCLPKAGYTEMVEAMLDHEKIELSLETVFRRSMMDNYDHVFSTMSIDEFYEFEHGVLDYRSIKFSKYYGETLFDDLKGLAATINFTSSHDPYTRATCWNKLPTNEINTIDVPTRQNPYIKNSYVTYETPCDFRSNDMERYYPLSDEKNKSLYETYRSIKDDKVTHLGRCGLYVYINMDQAVNSALVKSAKFLKC